MKLVSQRDRRNYIIIALCTVLVIMGVGYAAFSSLLTINGTANVSNSWCVGFDNTKTNTMNITKGVSAGTTPTGSMSYSGTACGSTLQPVSSLTAHFYQPGDQIEYTLTIKNKSSITAAIKSININDDENVTSDWSKTEDNITYSVNMPEDTTLEPNEETTMKVIAKFQNETDVTGPYTGETKNLSVSLNIQQDDGNGGMIVTEPPFTGTIYRSDDSSIKNGDSIVGTKNVWCKVQPSYEGWCSVNENEGYNSCEDDKRGFNTEQECLEDIYGWEGATCEQGTVPAYNSCEDDYIFETEQECLEDANEINGATCEQKTIKDYKIEFVTDSSEMPDTYYLKHDVVDDIITASYACFVTDTEHCMKGGDGGTSFSANTQIINNYMTFYNLNIVSDPNPKNSGCKFTSEDSLCMNNNAGYTYCDIDGGVTSTTHNASYCTIHEDSTSYCYYGIG